MADYVDPTIDELLTKYPEHLKLATQTPGSAPGSSVQTSAAQPKTSQKPKTTSKSKRHPMEDAGPRVNKRPLPIPAFHTNKGPRPTPTDSTSPRLCNSWSFGLSSDIEAATQAAATEAADIEAAEEAAAFILSAEADDIEAASESATPSRSGYLKAEPSLAELMELDRKDDQSADKVQEQSMSDLLPHLPASPEKPSTKRRTSPPLGHAIARRASVLNHPKQKPSRLRNEIYRCPADHDESANTNGEGPRVNANALERSDGFRGRSTDKKAIFGFGKESDVAKANRIDENSYLPAKSDAQEEGTTKANTTKDDLIVPPLAFSKSFEKSPEDQDWKLDIDKFADILLAFRDEGVGLSADELLKLPQEFRHIDQELLGLYWDFAYTPEIRREVLAFKHELAQAGKTNKELHWTHRLLLELVDTQEKVNHKGAKRLVDASDIKTNQYKESVAATTRISARLPDAKNIADTNNINASEHKESIPATTKQPAQFSVTDISLAAVSEFQQALEDPTYDITTRRQIFALYNGVKLDPTLTKILMDCYKNLLPHHFSSNTASVPNDTNKLVAGRLDSMELETPYKGEGKESDLPVEGTAFSPIEVEEKGLPIGTSQGKENEAGNSNVKAKGKKNKGKRKNKGKGKGGSESAMNDEAPDKDERKGRDMLMKDSAVGKGQRKDNELPLEDAMTGKGKVEESGALSKHPRTGNGSIGGQGFNILPIKTEDLNEKLDALLEFDMVKALASFANVAKENVREEMQKTYITIIGQAKALFLDPQSPGFIKSMGLKPNNESKSTASNAPPYDPDNLRDMIQFPLTNKEQCEIIIFLKVYTLMEDCIRPQTASVSEVKLACDLLRDPMVFAALRPLIKELNWNGVIISHPSNPMITRILLDTQEQRPSLGYRHPSGVFVWPLLPPGLAPATPMIHLPKKKQPMLERGGVSTPVKVKLPFEEESDVLVLKEATAEAMTRRGVPLRDAQASADAVATKQSEQYLQEKAKKPIVGGTAVDLLVGKQKKRNLKGLAAGNEYQMEYLAMRQKQMFERN